MVRQQVDKSVQLCAEVIHYWLTSILAFKRVYGSLMKNLHFTHNPQKLLTIEDGVVNVWPELPEHNGHSIERGI
jgi:hypothetical protein